MSKTSTASDGLRRGQIIREARSAADLTREHLASRAEVSVSTIVRLENADQLPNAESLARIAAVVGVSLDSLFASGVDA